MTAPGALSTRRVAWFLLLACRPAAAQHADDNAARAADDAFGTTVGLESVGIYDSSYVRGFSPQTAGNLRIEGLYFDQQGSTSDHLINGVVVRVGPSSHQYPFPAPTGIIDYSLRGWGRPGSLTTSLVAGPFESVYAHLDGVLPLNSATVRVPIGVAYGISAEIPGHSQREFTIGAVPQWRPSEHLSVKFLLDYVRITASRSQPRIYSDDVVPPPLVRPEFFGQRWADDAIRLSTSGAILNWEAAPQWTLRAGVFRSTNFSHPQFDDLLVDVQRDGSARHYFIGYPDQSQSSTSGEVRLQWRHADAAVHQSLTAVVRGRDVMAVYNGEGIFDAGVVNILHVEDVAAPVFTYSERTRDHSRLLAAGVAYDGAWSRRGEWSVGLQRESYRKQVDEPGLPRVIGSDHPWRSYINGSIALHGALSLYGSYTQGLEDSGLAPTNATNRGAPLPAVRTRQWDLGLRFAPGRALNVIAGVFDVRKPYFSLDSNGLFTTLGQQRHRGVEFSVTADPTSSLHVLAGAVFGRPRVVVDAPGAEASGIGSLAIGQADRVIELDLDYRLHAIPGASLSASFWHAGRRAANLNNSVILPSRTVMDVGARYQFTTLGGAAALRVTAHNVTRTLGWEVDEGGGYRPYPGRSYSVVFTLDR